MPESDFGFNSEEEFLKGMNRLEQQMLSMRDKAGIAAAGLYISQVKEKAIGLLRKYVVESELGRFPCRLSIHAVNSKASALRLKTAGYRRSICLLAKNNSFRSATDIFNQAYHRNGTGDELAYGTIAGDIEQEGKDARFWNTSAKQRRAF